MVRENVSLLPYNTFGVTVNARYFIEIVDEAAIFSLLQDPFFSAQPWTLIGGGSNLLFTRDVEGLVLHMAIKEVSVLGREGQDVLVRVGAGENWHQFVRYALEQGWNGLENLTLIPGTVGAAPIQNIGAYGVELEQVFHSLEGVDLKKKEMRTFTYPECQFGYRDSIFKREWKHKFIITHVTFRLTTATDRLSLTYGVIHDWLKQRGIARPTPQDVSQVVQAIRESKLPDPAVTGNCGSFFKNPAISREQFTRLQELYPSIPQFPAGEGLVKVPAGWLIEQCGWKGKRLGRAGCYHLQALVLVNLGGATGQEALALAQAIQQSVSARFGIELEPEVNIY
jgi:UDP-N-acetylmuramate dehydrogenase